MENIEILGICGSPVKNGNTELFLAEALKGAAETGGVNTKLIPLAGKKINDCIHCNWCLRKQEDLKPCAQKDDMADIFPEIIKADGLLLATPVYMIRLSGLMACFLDRLRGFMHGNLYHMSLTNKVGGALAVSWLRNRGAETALLSIVSAYLGQGMLVVAPPDRLGSAFGAVGVSSEGGTGRFNSKERQGVLRDQYGLEGAAGIGKRVAELAKLVKGWKQ